MTKYAHAQPMRIQARPGSKAEEAYRWASLAGSNWPMPKQIANGINPAPLEDLIFHGGKVVAQMEFQNVFLGKSANWSSDEASAIDSSILRAMQNTGLNNMMGQYFPGQSLSCDKRDPIFFDDASLANIGEADVQRIVTAMYDNGAISKTQLDSCIFNLLLPANSILGLGDVTSLEGLGGYHGSLHVTRAGRDITLYYSASVYSQTSATGQENGIVAFDAPWKNMVATLYHELNEFRTDADVNDAIAHKNNDLLGWNSRSGREVGDQPIFKAGNDLSLVFKEIPALPGPPIPVQFLYSNAVHGAEGPLARPLSHAST